MSAVDNSLVLRCDFNQNKILFTNSLDTESCTGLKTHPLSQNCLSLSIYERLSSDTSCVNVPEDADQDNKTSKENIPVSPSNDSILSEDEISFGNHSNASSPRSNVMEDQRSELDSAYGSLSSISRYNPQARRLGELPRLMIDGRDARRVDIRPSPQVRANISRRNIMAEEASVPQSLFDLAQIKCFLFGALCLLIIIAAFFLRSQFIDSESDTIVCTVILVPLMCFAIWNFQYYLKKVCIESREENVSAPISPAVRII